MTYFDLAVDWLIKPCVLLGCFLVLAKIAHKSSAASRHFLLATACMSLLLLPLSRWLLPHWSIQLLPQQWGKTLSTLVPDLWLVNLAAFVYLLGAIWILMYLLLGIVSLWRVSTRSYAVTADEDIQILESLRDAMNIKRPLRLVCSPEIHSPQVWGILQPVVMLPESSGNWPKDRKRFVLIHELAHVARWDWPLTIMVKLCCALFWFLPLVWMLKKRMAQAAEMACDDFIYRLHFDLPRQEGCDYADNLLQLALTEKNLQMDAALHINNGSPVYQRVTSLLDIKRQRDCLNSDQKGWTLLLGGVLLIVLAGLDAVVRPAHTMDLEKYYALHSLLTAAEDTSKDEYKNDISNTVFIWPVDLVEEPKPLPKITELVTVAPQQLVTSALFSEGLDAPVPAMKTSMSEPEISVQGYFPQYIVSPRYPKKALHFGVEGDVTVSFSITKNGSVDNVKVLHAEPKHFFEQEVLNAVAQFRYRPQLLQGQAVVVTGIEETFNFRLLNKNPEAKKSSAANIAAIKTPPSSLDHR